MGNIKEKIEIARGKVDDERLQLTLLDLEYTRKMIQRERANRPDATIDEIIESINKKYEDIMFNNVGLGFRNGRLEKTPDVGSSDYFCSATIQYLRKHLSEILGIIDRSDRKSLLIKKETNLYTYDMQKNIQKLMQDACSNFFENASESDINRFIEGNLSIKERANLQKFIADALIKYQTTLDKNIKDAYVRRVTQMAKILDENGCFDKGMELHNRRLRLMGLNDLQAVNTTKGGNKPQIRSMSDWTSVSIVNRLQLDTLIAASAFFTNRLCKEYISYKRSIFVLRELGLVGTLATTTSQKDIDETTLREALGKYYFLQSEARDIYTSTARNIKKDDTQRNGLVTTTVELPYSEEEIEEYQREYSRLLPKSQNDIIEDSQRFAIEDDVLEEMYQKKDYAMDTLIMSLLSRKTNLNWGYIPEMFNGMNSIQRGKRMVEIGFDLEGFSVPIRLHHSLGSLKQHIKGFTGKYELPVYEGNEDWTVEDQFGRNITMSTQIFIPTNKDERKKIKEMVGGIKEDNRLYKFLTHLNWIVNRSVPNRFNRRRVVSLETGAIRDRDEVSLDD